jgi:hypothetical protein
MLNHFAFPVLLAQFEPPEYYWAERLPHLVATSGLVTFSVVFDVLGLFSGVAGLLRGRTSESRPRLLYALGLVLFALFVEFRMILAYAAPSAGVLQHWIFSLLVWCASCSFLGFAIGLLGRGRSRAAVAPKLGEGTFFEERQHIRSTWIFVSTGLAWMTPAIFFNAIGVSQNASLPDSLVAGLIAFEGITLVPWVLLYRWATRVKVKVDSSELLVKARFFSIKLALSDIDSVREALFDSNAGDSVAGGVVRLNAKSLDGPNLDTNAVEVMHRNGKPMLIRTTRPRAMNAALNEALRRFRGSAATSGGL